VEATCRQASAGSLGPDHSEVRRADEPPFCQETFRRNRRWSLLFPRTAFDPAKN
jgi:hypothetical protein